MTPEELRKVKAMFPVSRDVEERSLNETDRVSQSANDKPPVRHRADGKISGKKGDGSRFLITITSFRRKLADPDGLCGKYFVDCLRYMGAIPDDDPTTIVAYSIKQQKAKEDRTEVEVIKL